MVRELQCKTSDYPHYDQVGSLRAITDTTGDVIKRIDYDSFGNIIADTNSTMTTPFGFAGGLYDYDTGLVRFGFRDYDPTIGRWTAKDPIDFAGGDVNLFGYVHADPVNLVDHLGLWEFAPFYAELYHHLDALVLAYTVTASGAITTGVGVVTTVVGYASTPTTGPAGIITGTAGVTVTAAGASLFVIGLDTYSDIFRGWFSLPDWFDIVPQLNMVPSLHNGHQPKCEE